MKKWKKALSVFLVCMTLAQMVPAALAANTNICTVTFDACGGTLTQSTIEKTCGEPYGELPKPEERSGYTFEGWFTAADGGGKVVSTDIVAAPTSGGVTLYAQWRMKYRVVFDPNGGDPMPDGSQYIEVNRGSPYGSLPLPPERQDYTFKGWYTNNVGGALITSDTIAELTGDQTLYAKWAAGAPQKYAVTFAANGGSLPMSGGQLSQATTNVVVTNGTKYGTLPTPVRPGYTFDGWYTGSTGGVKITEETLVNLTADQTLYAQWTKAPASSAITRLELAEQIYSAFPEKFALYYDSSVPYTDCGGLTARQLTILAALRDQRVMEAASGTLFKPDTTLSRAEGARIVSILLGADPEKLTASASLPYSDIYTHGAVAIIEYCQKRGVFPDAAGGSFRPDSLLSRKDAAAWLNNARAVSPAVDNSESITLPSAVAYEFYRCDLKEYYPNGVRFYAEDSLPYGLSLSTAGILSGTPNVASTYDFAVNAVDSAGRSTRLNLRLYVGTSKAQSWTYQYDVTGDPGYEIIQPIENLRGGASDSVLVSRGPYLQLKGVYLDGDLLVNGLDYVVSEDRSYHTRVMLYKQTLDTAGNGLHTVTLRFVDNNGYEKYASQSFTRTKSGSNPRGTVGRNVAPSSATVRPVSARTAVDTDSVGRITIDPDIRNGYVSLESRSVRAGQMAALTVTPVYGYRVDSVTVTSSNGNAVNVDHLSGDQYMFIMPNGDAEASAKFSREFTDVSPSAWYYDAAVWASDNGVVSGADSMTFHPDSGCTRAEMLTFLWRAKASPASGGAVKFTDVPAGSYYEDAVRWALNTGIVKGGGKKKFNPNQAITRGDAVTFLYRAAGSPATAPTSRFTDVDSGAYYARAVEWAVSNGVASGKGRRTFSPNAACTRAEVVAFLYRAMKQA